MSTGPDDFLTKPFHRDELQVRRRAGARVTRLIRELNETNRRMHRGLAAAGQIQRSFLPTTKPSPMKWRHGRAHSTRQARFARPGTASRGQTRSRSTTT